MGWINSCSFHIFNYMFPWPISAQFIHSDSTAGQWYFKHFKLKLKIYSGFCLNLESTSKFFSTLLKVIWSVMRAFGFSRDPPSIQIRIDMKNRTGHIFNELRSIQHSSALLHASLITHCLLHLWKLQVKYPTRGTDGLLCAANSLNCYHKRERENCPEDLTCGGVKISHWKSPGASLRCHQRGWGSNCRTAVETLQEYLEASSKQK